MFSGTSFLLTSFIVVFVITETRSQCPWQRDILELQTSCICAYNLGLELSVQCDQVKFPILIDALNTYAKEKPIDLLYINNSTIKELHNKIFANLSVHNVQLSNCQISKIGDDAFYGQEAVLKNLNLQDNLLTEVPIKAVKRLSKLNLLDLSKNLITIIPDRAFSGLSKLSTLKLNDNNVTLETAAFSGLEDCLKNLNLKGTRQRRIPESIRGLTSLAFLDLSLNGIKELPGPGGIRTFDGLNSLTALNLERNFIQSLGETSFAGIRKTLSSLSLLNNLLAEFPIGAIHALKELRVLDIGFNLLTTLPEVAFRGNPSITLLALDGNPLSTVPQNAFAHLNSTLRGLSLGGRFLHCDCKLRWVAEWIRNSDLQVTSRERNPQFCGSPTRFRDRGFYSIQPEELTCLEKDIVANNTNVEVEHLESPSSNSTLDFLPTTDIKNKIADIRPNKDSNRSELLPFLPANITTANTSTGPTKPTPIRTTPSSTIAPTKFSTILSSTVVPNSAFSGVESSTLTTKPSSSSVVTNSVTTIAPNGNASNINSHNKQSPTWRQNTSTASPVITNGTPHKQQRPPLVLGFPPQRGTRIDDANEVQVKNAFRQDNSVIIQWDSDTANILGFRVVYRLFGEKTFKQGPPLEASEREFKIKNVPSQECIIVCVISLEELHVTPETVPYQQCREVRTVASQTSNMDKITIAASAAICGTIIVAVIVFIAASRRSRNLQNTQQKSPLPIGGLPVNCCGPAGSPGPLGSIATLSAFNNHKEWDQVSAYSGRSIPRPRIYPADNQDDIRGHFSGIPGKVGNARSIADGQSQHSFSNNSHRGYLGAAFPTNLINSRPELRQSRQSLAAASERMSRASYAGSIQGPTSIASSTRRSRPRSRSREQLNATHIHNHRPGSRYSHAGSTHTLNNYCDTSDNWTDHDMDIYMARNPTTRNGLVPL
ncbi:leucine-rich repeat and fibronectin type-III domain-containing protein 2 isoform X2 [Anastrepha ludens]|uniref:leucine-rich repeat and fibronectin type-III domain-containing protein 2 isoform X2 n=1 Tax=Anastrepha ludens TaxID=28586 RepID=UPI0023AFD33F|nr:leucine-rich repeat and fibronectin type-III domain-containing protein 2 isoform X2 [Anastrepha ludens]